MTIHIMLDLETMGNKPNAAITAIGAVAYNDETKEEVSTFYRIVNLEDSVGSGLTMDASTVLWWMQQEQDAKSIYSEINQDTSYGLKHALHDYTHWVKLFNTDRVLTWGNGVGFDNVILRNAYDKTGIPCPFPFYNDRCYRTLKNMHKDVKLERVGTYHNALDDARSQMNHLIAIFEEVGYCE